MYKQAVEDHRGILYPFCDFNSWTSALRTEHFLKGMATCVSNA